MVDRIEKVDPSLYRVQEARDEGNRRQREEEEEKKKDKDKFQKGKPFWERLIRESASRPKGGIAARTVPQRLTPLPETAGDETEEEVSLTLSQRVLVLWGILDLQGKPRIPVIATYAVVVTVIALAAALMIGILWR